MAIESRLTSLNISLGISSSKTQTAYTDESPAPYRYPGLLVADRLWELQRSCDAIGASSRNKPVTQLPAGHCLNLLPALMEQRSTGFSFFFRHIQGLFSIGNRRYAPSAFHIIQGEIIKELEVPVPSDPEGVPERVETRAGLSFLRTL